jgi:hypothetical protein
LSYVDLYGDDCEVKDVVEWVDCEVAVPVALSPVVFEGHGGVAVVRKPGDRQPHRVRVVLCFDHDRVTQRVTHLPRTQVSAAAPDGA